MKLHRNLDPAINMITAYEADHVMINAIRHDGNLLVTASQIIPGWASGGFEHLTTENFAAIAALAPAIVLIGTGNRQRFPAPALLRPLMDARIGFEIMDMRAACRTFNILVDEGRNVAAALLFDPASPAG